MRLAFTMAVMLAALAVGTTACTSVTLPATNVLGVKKDPARPPTYNGMALKSGQFVLTESPDATSYAFFLIPRKFYPFTHIAVISVEDGEPWVYDVTGGVKTLPFKKRLMDNVTGKMYRRKLFEYVAPNLYAEIYDPPAGVDGEKVAAFVRQKFNEKVEFDGYFDSHDHSKLFCSELVSLAVASAGGPSITAEPSSQNPSILAAMKWLGVPVGEALPPWLFVDPSRYVAALGQFPTRTAAWSYFEGKREIYRRFTMDQRMGFLLSMNGNGQLDVRPHVTSFTIAASHLFDSDPNPPEPGDPRIELAVRKLADERFGPFGAPLAASAAPGAPTTPVAAVQEKAQ